jgi:ABC-2 type transport system permease protein
MNLRAIAAIYRFEMGRTFRTLGQSVVSPVLTTSLYFVVFGAAIGSRIQEVEGVSYGAFIVPGLIMLTVLTAGDQQRVLRDLFPEIRRHDLRASVGAGVVSGGDGGLRAGRRDQGLMIGLIILGTSFFFVDIAIAHPVWMVAFLVLTCVSASRCSGSSSASGRRISSSCSWCRLLASRRSCSSAGRSIRFRCCRRSGRR